MESPETWFHRRATSYVEAQVLFHLNQVGVFGLLNDEGVRSVEQIASSLALETSATAALLDYVFEVDDLLDRDESGRYALSEFGKSVVRRYSDMKADRSSRSINMFDVRVGAYGPVWQNLSRMLNGEAEYGREFHRDGRFAENGVFKLAMNFWRSLVDLIDESGPESVVELGVTSGLLERLREKYPHVSLHGLDKSRAALDETAARASEKGLAGIRLVQADYFDIDEWTKAVDRGRKGMIFSLHFHEIMARGEKEFVESLRGLKAALPDWTVVAIEQPKLPRKERSDIPEALWLYAQSNVLIHHLIGNGKVLESDAWIDLGRQAGCRSVTDRACDYLGYRAFVFQL